MPGVPERRRHSRFPVAGRLAGNLLNIDLPFQVQDMSLGGFSISTPARLEPGTQHEARFLTAGDRSTVVHARVANLRTVTASDGAPSFVVGFAFAPVTSPKTIAYRLQESWLTFRYQSRLLTRPWEAQWVEGLIDDRLGRTSPVRLLVDRARFS